MFLIGGTNICAADYVLKILVIHYLSKKDKRRYNIWPIQKDKLPNLKFQT